MRMKKIIIICLALIMTLAFASCGAAENGAGSGADGAEVSGTVSISFGIADDLKDIPEYTQSSVLGNTYTVDITEGMALSEALKTLAQKEKFVLSKESGSIEYVVNIDGISQSDTKGWIYTINGESTTDAVNQCILKDGDFVEWTFLDWTTSDFEM